MVAQLLKVIDPRDPLQKATRDELEEFAIANGIKEIEPGMPKPLMVARLRQRGITNIGIPDRVLGQQLGGDIVGDSIVGGNKIAEVGAEEELERQWKSQENPPPEPPPIATMTIQELRKACRAKGIKLERTDNIAKLREKLSG